MGSSSGWRLGQGLVSELRESDSSVSVLVELLHHLVYLLPSHEVAAGLDHALQLGGVNGTVVIQVKGVKSLVAVKSGAGAESLAQGLGLGFNSEVGPPHLLKLEGGAWQEAVISSDGSGSVVRSSSLHLAGVVAVMGQECFLEFVKSQSSVSVCVVSGQEKVDLFRGWEYVDGV
jgi:hypothetical protein